MINVYSMPTDKNKSAFFPKIVIISFLLYYVLQTYGYGKYNITFVLLTTLAFFSVLKNGLRSSMPKLLTSYFAYWVCVFVVMANSLLSAIPLGIGRTYLIYNMIYKEFNYFIFLKYYKIFAIIFIAFFIFQDITYLLTGTRVIGVIQTLPLALNVEDASQFYETIANINRSASVFSEPSHFAQFLGPLLAILLFNKPKRNDMIFAGFILFTMLRLQSGTAIFLTLVILTSFVIYRLIMNLSFRTILISSFLAMTIFLIVASLMNTEAGTELLERQKELTEEQSMNKSASSGFIRVYRGYFIYAEMTNVEKVFGGDSFERMRRAIDKSPFHWTFRDDEFYFNCFQTLLIKTGIIGTILFFVFYCWLFRRVEVTGKVVLLALLCLFFIEAIHFRETMIFYLIIASSFPKIKAPNLIKPNNKSKTTHLFCNR